MIDSVRERGEGAVTDVAAFLRDAERLGANNYHPLPIVLERGEGVWVWDTEGRRYLDMLSAYSALNHGHRHPAILDALREQADRLTLTSRAFHSEPYVPFLRELGEAFGYEKTLPMNTGAEAVETAIKAARRWGYERKGVPDDGAEIVVCEGNFHGRTTTIVSFSSERSYRKGFGPMTPGFRIIPYGDVDALANALNERTVAFLVEPIQGEAGVVVPPDGYLRQAAELCRERNVLLVADEIQTGLGRTGRLLASEWEDVRPDVLILGKALGGGVYPVSAVLADSEIMDVFTPGSHGSTFGGNPLAMAVGRAALRVLIEEELPRRAAELGAWYMDELRALRSPHVAEVRGRGLMIGVVIRNDSGPARPFCEALMDRGILAKETHEQVVRLAPPLVVGRDVLESTIPILAEVLEASS